MECIHLLQRVEIFLKDDLQKEKLSEHVSQKLLELQCIIQNFLGKTDSYKSLFSFIRFIEMYLSP